MAGPLEAASPRAKSAKLRVEPTSALPWKEEERWAYAFSLCLVGAIDQAVENATCCFLFDAISMTPLPGSWSMRRDTLGQIAFIDKGTGKFSRMHPLEKALRHLAGFARVTLKLPLEARGPCIEAMRQTWQRDSASELERWHPLKSSLKGKTYYCNKDTKETTWEHPYKMIMPEYYMKFQMVDKLTDASYTERLMSTRRPPTDYIRQHARKACARETATQLTQLVSSAPGFVRYKSQTSIRTRPQTAGAGRNAAEADPSPSAWPPSTGSSAAPTGGHPPANLETDESSAVPRRCEREGLREEKVCTTAGIPWLGRSASLAAHFSIGADTGADGLLGVSLTRMKNPPISGEPERRQCKVAWKEKKQVPSGGLLPSIGPGAEGPGPGTSSPAVACVASLQQPPRPPSAKVQGGVPPAARPGSAPRRSTPALPPAAPGSEEAAELAILRASEKLDGVEKLLLRMAAACGMAPQGGS